jgi:PAS domain S-box-containing protein
MTPIAKSRTPEIAPDVDWRQVERNEHFVQFYESDDFLLESISGFIGSGLAAGESAIVIATKGHRKALEARMQENGIEVAAAVAEHRYRSLDAADLLDKFMVNGAPDEKLFLQVAGALVSEAGQSGKGLRVYGEMVAVLWAEGNETAAIRLEGLWNELRKENSFSLFCAYPIEGFGGAAKSRSFLRICAEHSHVIPDESYSARTTRDARLRNIALLQQQARALHRETAERKRMEAASRHLASIVQYSDDAIASKDLNGIITSWNDGARRLFGYTAEEIVGKSVLLLIPLDRHNEEPRILERIRKGETVDHYETVRQRKDGSLIDISLTVSPIKDDKGAVVGISKIARDISERKRVERELQVAREQLARANEHLEKRVQERTDSLQKAVAQMEEFSYTVSHDLRTPLRGMSIYATALMEDYSANLPAEAIRYLKRIVDNAVLLDKMVLDVLTLSRVARAALHIEKVSLNHLLEELVEQYRNMPAPAELQIDVLLDVMGHKPSLIQVISNLLNNATKFVPPGVAPKVRIWTERRESFIRLWVEDNGIGIPTKYQHRLFGMFERIHPHLNYEGSGVGLAIVRKATERMGGKAGVESDGSHGSRFWVELRGAA